jgi:putative membrane protein
MYPSLVIADSVVPKDLTRVRRWMAVAAVGGVVMTAWDVAMDPMMVAGGSWVWEVQGAYFGVPLQNYWGWWLTTFVALAIYLALAARMRGPQAGGGLSDRWAVGVYLVMGGSSILVDLLTGLQGAALAGIFAMLPWMVIGMVQHE